MKNVNINFFVSGNLGQKIDAAMKIWGFGSRAEFFRFCAIEFLKSEAQTIVPDDTIKGYSRAIQSVKSAKWLAKHHFQS